MRIAAVSLILLSSCLAFAQETKHPKLSVHTWVREDIFAAWLFDDLDRLEKGARKIDQILEETPDHPVALSWRGGVEIYRAVRALESGREGLFATHFERARQSFDRAYELNPKDIGVLAVVGGSYAVFADRLPEEHAAAAWKRSDLMYRAIAEGQASFLDKLPVHLKGEVMAGLAMSAHRTGDRDRATGHLQQIIATMPGTPYEARARKWMEQPETAEKSSLICQTCHDPGRLENVLTRLDGK